MDATSVFNLVAACFCACVSGWSVGTKHYGWAAIDGGLAILNFAVAWL